MPLAPHTYASPTVVDEYLDAFFPLDYIVFSHAPPFGDPQSYEDARATARAMLYAALRRHHVIP